MFGKKKVKKLPGLPPYSIAYGRDSKIRADLPQEIIAKLIGLPDDFTISFMSVLTPFDTELRDLRYILGINISPKKPIESGEEYQRLVDVAKGLEQRMKELVGE